MKKATIYDYARLCGTVITCDNCPMCATLNGTNLSCDDLLIRNTDKANEIILNWCKEHPAETRQDKFLEQYPNVRMDNRMVISICPKKIDSTFEAARCDAAFSCEECRKQYWLAEVDENE